MRLSTISLVAGMALVSTGCIGLRQVMAGSTKPVPKSLTQPALRDAGLEDAAATLLASDLPRDPFEAKPQIIAVRFISNWQSDRTDVGIEVGRTIAGLALVKESEDFCRTTVQLFGQEKVGGQFSADLRYLGLANDPDRVAVRVDCTEATQAVGQ